MLSVARHSLSYLFTSTPDDKAWLSKMVEPIAKKHWDEIIFCTIDKDDVERFPVYADYIWLASFEATWSSFAIRDSIKNYRYAIDSGLKLSEENRGTFVRELLEGKVKPKTQSEPLPEQADMPRVEDLCEGTVRNVSGTRVTPATSYYTLDDIWRSHDTLVW